MKVYCSACSTRLKAPRTPTKVFTRSSSNNRTLRFYISVLPSWRQAECSVVQNPSWPLSSVPRCPVMTHDAIKLSGPVFVRSGRASPKCFTGRWVTPFHGVPYPRPQKRAGMKFSRSACSTRLKASPMPGMSCCTNVHPMNKIDRKSVVFIGL